MDKRKSSIQHGRKTTEPSSKKAKQLNQEVWTIGETLHGAEIAEFLEWFRRQNIPMPMSLEDTSKVTTMWMIESRRRKIDYMLKQLYSNPVTE